MQGYFIENEMLRRRHGYEQDMITSALTPSGPVVEEMVASLLVNIIGPQLMVWFRVGEPMEGTDHHRVGHRDDGPVSPAPGC
jgi:hypothetical protein